jgi:hypothetical protein
MGVVSRLKRNPKFDGGFEVRKMHKKNKVIFLRKHPTTRGPSEGVT